MIEWFLVVQLAVTGQIAVVRAESETHCRSVLLQIAAGIPMQIMTKENLRLPIARGISCKTKDEVEREFPRPGAGV
jgi:hypothetical protein